MPLHNYFINRRWSWIFFMSAVGLGLLVGELVNGRLWMHDLEVYYKTAARLVNGRELYRIAADGHYVFKYSPTAAMYFIPLLLLPFSLAKIFYWFVLTGLTVWAFGLLYKLMAATGNMVPDYKKRNVVLMLTFLAVAAHLHREWHLGQVNLLLLIIYIGLISLLMQNKNWLAGLFLALSLFIKPFGLIFLPYLLFRQQYKPLLFALAFVLFLGLMPLIFYPEWVDFKYLYQGWFTELIIELQAKQDLLASANHTVFSVVARFTPLRYLLNSGLTISIYQLVILLVIGVAFLLFIRMGRYLPTPVLPEMTFLIALIPLFSFTSYNAFLFAAPCIMLLIFYFQQFSVLGKLSILVGCLLVGANIRDLVGPKFFNFLENISVYSFGSILLLILLFIWRIKQSRQLAAV